MPTVLITGCSSGFGLSAARLFLERGWSVVATMRAPRDGLLPPSEHLRVLPMDVTDKDSILSGMAEAGPIDALVNNAGGGLLGAVEAASAEGLRELFDLNAFGTMVTTSAALPGMRARGSGVIVNMSSAVTLKPLPLLAAYTASKAAVEAFSEVLSLEVAPFGIRVRLVIPGRSPETSFGASARARSVDGIPEAYLDWSKQAMQPVAQNVGKTTSASEVADAVWSAVTDPTSPFRIPVGADALALAPTSTSLQ